VVGRSPSNPVRTTAFAPGVVIHVTDDRAAGSRHAPSGRLGELAELLSIGQAGSPNPTELVRLAAIAVPNSEHAGLTLTSPRERPAMLAHSDDLAARLDAIQLELGDGPGLDVIEHSDLVHVPDLEVDERWPTFARRAAAEGVRSVVAVRMKVETYGRAALTFYARRANSFTDLDFEIAAVFGSLVGVALQSERHREHAANLEIALESNRQIGTAIGVLMARELLTSDQAFDRLRGASQRLHRKLRDIAVEVTNTGELPST
jgi:ANTAR domain